MATQVLINIGSGNGLLPDGTKPLPEPACWLIIKGVLWHVTRSAHEHNLWHVLENYILRSYTTSQSVKAAVRFTSIKQGRCIICTSGITCSQKQYSLGNKYSVQNPELLRSKTLNCWLFNPMHASTAMTLSRIQNINCKLIWDQFIKKHAHPAVIAWSST